MKAKICFCPKSIAWILRNLKKSAKARFRAMTHPGFDLITTDFSKKSVQRKFLKKKRRTAKQRAATRRLIAFNKRRRN